MTNDKTVPAIWQDAFFTMADRLLNEAANRSTSDRSAQVVIRAAEWADLVLAQATSRFGVSAAPAEIAVSVRGKWVDPYEAAHVMSVDRDALLRRIRAAHVTNSAERILGNGFRARKVDGCWKVWIPDASSGSPRPVVPGSDVAVDPNAWMTVSEACLSLGVARDVLLAIVRSGVEAVDGTRTVNVQGDIIVAKKAGNMFSWLLRRRGGK